MYCSQIRLTDQQDLRDYQLQCQKAQEAIKAASTANSNPSAIQDTSGSLVQNPINEQTLSETFTLLKTYQTKIKTNDHTILHLKNELETIRDIQQDRKSIGFWVRNSLGMLCGLGAIALIACWATPHVLHITEAEGVGAASAIIIGLIFGPFSASSICCTIFYPITQKLDQAQTQLNTISDQETCQDIQKFLNEVKSVLLVMSAPQEALDHTLKPKYLDQTRYISDEYSRLISSLKKCDEMYSNITDIQELIPELKPGLQVSQDFETHVTSVKAIADPLTALANTLSRVSKRWDKGGEDKRFMQNEKEDIYLYAMQEVLADPQKDIHFSSNPQDPQEGEGDHSPLQASNQNFTYR